MDPIRFSSADLNHFAAFSRDLNPLHGDAAYARRTPFGEPLVFGMLAAIACLGQLRERASYALASAMIDFPNPIFPETDYVATVEESEPEQATVTLCDGRRTL